MLYWFTGIDDAYDFNLLKVALYSAKINTTLTPVVLYTSLSNSKLSYLEAQDIMIKQVKVDGHIARGQGFLPVSMYGALLKIYVPMIADEIGVSETILYSDVDVIFLADPPQLDATEVLASSYYPMVKPGITRAITECSDWRQMIENGGSIVNAGVMYMNIESMLQKMDSFMELCKKPGLSNAPAESVYHFYKIDYMSYEYNWFAYWGDQYAKVYWPSWVQHDLKALEPPKIIHFHGPKPGYYKQPDELSDYVTKEFYFYKNMWMNYKNVCDKESDIIISDLRVQWYY